MIEHVQLILTEAVEIAAKAVAEKHNIDWDDAAPMVKFTIREQVSIPVTAAAPYIVKQVLADIASRAYEIG